MRKVTLIANLYRRGVWMVAYVFFPDPCDLVSLTTVPTLDHEVVIVIRSIESERDKRDASDEGVCMFARVNLLSTGSIQSWCNRKGGEGKGIASGSEKKKSLPGSGKKSSSREKSKARVEQMEASPSHLPSICTPLNRLLRFLSVNCIRIPSLGAHVHALYILIG
jgi:hypothetical protein